MPLTAEDLSTIQSFRSWLCAEVRRRPEWFGVLSESEPRTADRDDHSTLATRFSAADDTHFEVAIRPGLPAVRVGVATDSRWRNEELEERIEETGDEMEEYIEQAFADVDLDWVEPPVEHYREQQKWFCFVTPLELVSVSELGKPATRDKILRMLAGYWAGFGKVFAPKPQ